MGMPIVKKEHLDEILSLSKETILPNKSIARLAILEMEAPMKRDNPILYNYCNKELPVRTPVPRTAYFLLHRAAGRPLPFVELAMIQRRIAHYALYTDGIVFSEKLENIKEKNPVYADFACRPLANAFKKDPNLAAAFLGQAILLYSLIEDANTA